jgi:hypothetical protein
MTAKSFTFLLLLSLTVSVGNQFATARYACAQFLIQEFTDSISPSTETAENEFVDKLRMKKQEHLFKLANLEEKEFSLKLSKDRLIEIEKQAIKIVETEIAIANWMIESGKPFGESEFRSTEKRINFEITLIDPIEVDLLSFEPRELADAKDELETKIHQAASIEMEVYNLNPDLSEYERSTRTISVTLLNGETVVWKRASIELEAHGVKTSIVLPTKQFTNVVVDVVKWRGIGAGLAEIQILIDDENIAFGRLSKVNSTETLPIHLDDQDSFTDGIKDADKLGEGYWIGELDSPARIEIDLLRPRIKREISRVRSRNFGRKQWEAQLEKN